MTPPRWGTPPAAARSRATSAATATGRVHSAVLAGAVPPLMLQTPDWPEGTPRSVFDGLRAGVLADRSQFYTDLSEPFYGANRPGNKISHGLREQFWRLSMQVGLAPSYDCIKAFSETDFRAGIARHRRPRVHCAGRRRPDRADQGLG